MRRLFFLLSIFLNFICTAQVTLQTIYETPSSNINVYIVSQGYTSDNISEFDTFANGLLTTLWNTVPFNEFQSNFRVILVRDIASINTYPRAFNQFNPAYLCGGGSATDSESYESYNLRMDQLINQYIPSYNDNSYLIAIFNNNYYTAGGGKYTFATNYCSNPFMYNVIIHEFGHTFGLLGDEYSDTQVAVNAFSFPLLHNRNITMETQYNNIPWKYLININTPIPTCSYNATCSSTVSGLYESANYTNLGWFRPQNKCKMKATNDPFCLTCCDILRETIKKHKCVSNVSINESFEFKHQNIVHWRKSSDNMSISSVIGNNIKLKLIAQNTIILSNGFHSKLGSIFNAYIGDCSFIDIRNQYRTFPKLNFELIASPKQLTIDSKNFSKNFINVYNENNEIIIMTNENPIVNVKLFSIDGKLIQNVIVENEFNLSLNFSDHAKGIYIIEIKTNDNKTEIRKIIN